MVKKFISVIAAAAAAITMALPASSAVYIEPDIDMSVSKTLSADNYIQLSGQPSYNLLNNEYDWPGRWAMPVRSYLNEEDGYLLRTEYISSKNMIFAEKYTKDGELISTTQIEPELPVFGGFYYGRDYNFLVYGQYNPEESNSTEIMRVVKYSKDWDRLDSVSVFGANSVTVFDGGSLRMAESNGILYIHTCHEMYQIEGVNHQANMTFIIDQGSMKIIEDSSDINGRTGYASHSFNQFIRIAGTEVYRVDHGDAYPRGIQVSRFNTTSSIKTTVKKELFDIPGNIGDNDTGVALGGFEVSQETCLIAGNSIDRSATPINYDAQRNIFLLVLKRGSMDMIDIRNFTDYANGSNVTVNNPQLVDLKNNEYLLMWREYPDGAEESYMKMCRINQYGDLLTDIVQVSMSPSDCQPIYCSDGLVRWYVTVIQGNAHASLCYHVDPYDLEASAEPIVVLGDVNVDGAINAIDASLVLKEYAARSTKKSSTLTDYQVKAADVNSDGTVDSLDSCCILSYYSYLMTGGMVDNMNDWLANGYF